MSRESPIISNSCSRSARNEPSVCSADRWGASVVPGRKAVAARKHEILDKYPIKNDRSENLREGVNRRMLKKEY
jgi:hypothetical protein